MESEAAPRGTAQRLSRRSHAILDPSIRWFPADEALRESTMDKYMKADGDISNYHPDFVVKLPGNRVVIVETKGQQDTDVKPKMSRLKQWCDDVNRLASGVTYDFVYVDEESFKTYAPKVFQRS